jgi:hypothetical protein
VKDVAGQGTRVAGQVCTSNSDCASNFCEDSLGICIDPCCSDNTCPNGLLCEQQDVAVSDTQATNARVCMNLSVGRVLQRK